MIRSILAGLFSVLIILSITCAGEAPPSSAPPQTLRITALTQMEDQVYGRVSLEFPKDWKDPKFTVEAAGKTVKSRPVSGGFSTDRAEADLVFAPFRTGKQTVIVRTIVDGKKVESKGTLDLKPTPFVVMIDHSGDREIVGANGKLTVATANIYDTTIYFNGKSVHVKPTMSGTIQILSFQPAWKKGKNLLTVSANKSDGGVIARNFSFFSIADGGALPIGQVALIHYGRPGSKSGPFYDVKIDGDAVKPLKDVTVRKMVIDKDGWLVPEGVLAREVEARQEGTSKVRIFVKHHFLEKMELEKEFTLTVGQP